MLPDIMLTADFCREPFSLNSGAIFESIVIKIDSRLMFDRESFVLILISLYSALALP